MIIRNAMQTPDGTVIESTFCHDYITHLDANGKEYMVDGGMDYIRRTVHSDQIDLSVHSDDTHDKIRQAPIWGTYGKCGTQPLKRVTLAEMSTNHIEAILKTQTQISETLRNIFKNELIYRGTK